MSQKTCALQPLPGGNYQFRRLPRLIVPSPNLSFSLSSVVCKCFFSKSGSTHRPSCCGLSSKPLIPTPISRTGRPRVHTCSNSPKAVSKPSASPSARRIFERHTSRRRRRRAARNAHPRQTEYRVGTGRLGFRWNSKTHRDRAVVFFEASLRAYV